MSYDIFRGRDIPDSERQKMPEEDFAGKGRSFPIQTPEDVHDAAASIGRAGGDNHSPEELKANIKKIAKRKGPAFEAKLPAAWKVDACDSVSMAMSDKGPRFAMCLGELTDRVTRIPVAILGKFVKGVQKFAITRETMAKLIANFRKRPADTVIDYEHASEFVEAAQGQPIPASGWIKSIDDEPDANGILWGTAEFTPRAAAMIESKEYRYISPVIDYGARDKHSGESQGPTLVSAALTNRPFLEGMPAIAMSDWQKGSAAATRTEEETKRVAVKKLILADRVAFKVRVVADDDTESTITLEGLEAPPTVVRLADVKRGKDGRYDFAGLPQEGDVLIASDVIRMMTVDRELDAAVAAGKVTPAQRPQFEKLALTDLAGFRTLVETMPVQVELSERGLAGNGTERNTVGAPLEQINTEIAKRRTANKGLSYGDAWRLVASDRPELIKAYNDAAAAGGKK